MKNKRFLTILLSVTATVVIGLSLMLAIFIKETKDDNANKNNSPTIEASTGAVTADASEKGGAIFLQDGAVYTMNGGGTSSFSQVYGGTVYVSSGATFIMNNGIIKNGKANYGGAIYVEDGGTCIINNGTIENCDAENYGGAIYVEQGGTLTINGGNIENCSGYGIFAESDENLTIKNANFISNDVALFINTVNKKVENSSSNNIALDGCVFDSNNYGVKFGATSLSSVVINLTNCEFDSNTTQSISLDNNLKLTLVLDDTIIDGGNVAESDMSFGANDVVYLVGDTRIVNHTGIGLNLSSGAIANLGTDSKDAIIPSRPFEGCISGNASYGIKVDQSTLNVVSDDGIIGVATKKEVNYSGNKTSGIYAYNSNVNLKDISILGNGNSSTSCNGGGIYYATNSSSYTLNIDEGTNIAENRAYNGGGIYYTASTKNTLTFIGGTISGNEATNYGGGVYCSGSNMLMGDDLSWGFPSINNNQACLGGGIYLSNSFIDMQAGKVSNNIATSTVEKTASGGGIYLASKSVANISCPSYLNGSFVASGVMNNSSTYRAGGICVQSGCTMYLSSGTCITGNSSEESGGGIVASGTLNIGQEIYNYGKTNQSIASNVFLGAIAENSSKASGGGIYISSGTLNHYSGVIGETSFSDEFGTYKYGGNLAPGGSGVSIYSAATYNLDGGSVIGNIGTTTSGCAIAVNKSSSSSNGSIFNFISGLIDSNTVSEGISLNGGAIRVFAGCTLNMSGGTISNHTINSNGGAIYVQGTATITGGKISECSAKNNGGAIYNQAGTLNITNLEIKNCSAKSGGAIYCGAKSTVSKTTISDCSATNGGAIYNAFENDMNELNIYGCSASSGGAIYLGSYLNLYGLTTIWNCTATDKGGLIYGSSGSTLSMKNGWLELASAPYGGGIYTLGMLEIEGVSFQECYATYGGAIYSDSEMSTIDSCMFTECGVSKQGGAIYTSAAQMDIKGGKIDNCYAEQGGAIYVQDYSSVLNILKKQDGEKTTEINITNNSATKSAAAIYVNKATLNMSAGKITNNLVETIETNYNVSGGAIAFSNAIINISGGEISHHKLSTECASGAVLRGAGLRGTGILTISGDAVISYNESNMLGGGIYMSNGTFTNSNGETVWNALNITGGTISNNKAPSGAGIYVGGGEYVEDTTTFNISGGIISENIAEICGAGVQLSHITSYFSGNYKIENNKIDRSKCSEFDEVGGVGISVTGGKLEIAGGEISGNKIFSDTNINAVMGGGILINNGAIVTMNGGKFDTNTACPSIAKSSGGNIYVHLDSTFIMNGGYILGDGSTVQAQLGGGIASVGIVELNGGSIQNCVAVNGGGVGSYGGFSVSIDDLLASLNGLSNGNYDLTANNLKIGSVSILDCVASIGESIAVGGKIDFHGNPEINGNIALSATEKVTFIYDTILQMYPTITVSGDFEPVNQIYFEFAQANCEITVDPTYTISSTKTLMVNNFVDTGTTLVSSVDGVDETSSHFAYSGDEYKIVKNSPTTLIVVSSENAIVFEIAYVDTLGNKIADSKYYVVNSGSEIYENNGNVYVGLEVIEPLEIDGYEFNQWYGGSLQSGGIVENTTYYAEYLKYVDILVQIQDQDNNILLEDTFSVFEGTTINVDDNGISYNGEIFEKSTIMQGYDFNNYYYYDYIVDGDSASEKVLTIDGCKVIYFYKQIMKFTYDAGTAGYAASLYDTDYNQDLTIYSTYSYPSSGVNASVGFLKNATSNSIKITKIADNGFEGTSITGLTLCEGLQIIGNSAFNNCVNLTGELVIPASVQKIGTTINDSNRAYCFYKTGLTSLSFKENSQLTQIGSFAFAFCGSLKFDLVIPKNVETIGSSAFYKTKVLSLSFETGSKLKNIYGSAFSNCTELTGDIEIPSTVINISNACFSNSSITGIDLSNCNLLSTIGRNAFNGCTRLSGTVIIPSSVRNLGERIFYNCKELDNVILNAKIAGLGLTVVDGNQSETGSEMFAGCANLDEVVLGYSGLTTIGYYFFKNCSGMTQLTIPNSVTTIQNTEEIQAFAGCSNLKFVHFGSGITNWGTYLFNESPYLSRITFDDNITTIGANAFNGCLGTNLEISLAGKIQEIGASAFNNSNVQNVGIHVKSTYTLNIGESAFENCLSLTDLLLENEYSEYSETNINVGNRAFFGCSYLKNLRINDSNTNLGSIVLGDQAFQNCYSLKKLDLGCVSSIGESCFEDCVNVEEIETGRICRIIKNRAFLGMPFLNYVYIDSPRIISGYDCDSCDGTGFVDYNKCSCGFNPQVFALVGDRDIEEACGFDLELGDSANIDNSYLFYKSYVKTITLNGRSGGYSTYGEFNSYSFLNCPKLESIYIPSFNFDTYYRYVNRLKDCFVYYTNNWHEVTAYLSFYEGQLKGSSDDASDDYDGYVTDWGSNWMCINGYQDKLNIVYLLDQPADGDQYKYYLNEDKASYSVGAKFVTFANTSIEIPSTHNGKPITKIYKSGFSGCSDIQSVTIPSSITVIGDYAFQNCRDLTTVNLPTTITEIGDYAFQGCSKLTTVTNVSNTNIGSYAFASLSGLTINGLTFTNDKTIGEYAFYNTNLTGTINIDTTEIADFAFAKTKITGIEIGANVENISSSAFAYCGNLTTINVAQANSVYMSKWAFSEDLVIIDYNAIVEYMSFDDYVDKIYEINNREIDKTSITTFISSIWKNVMEMIDLLNLTHYPGTIIRGCASTKLNMVNPSNTSLSINWGITDIGDYAFSGCTGLTSFEMPRTLNTIGDYAFDGCLNLNTVTLDRVYMWGLGLSSIGAYAFANCGTITTLEMHVFTNIKNNTFSNTDATIERLTQFSNIIKTLKEFINLINVIYKDGLDAYWAIVFA